MDAVGNRDTTYLHPHCNQECQDNPLATAEEEGPLPNDYRVKGHHK